MFEVYFTNDPVLTEAPDESNILEATYQQVAQGFSFVSFDRFKQKTIVDVHRGFLTRGQSIPRLAKHFVEKWLGIDHFAVVLHDWLYEYLLIERNYSKRPITQLDAIEIFGRALETTDLPLWKQDVLLALYYTSWAFRNVDEARHWPYKRYVEDRSHSRIN